MPPAGTSTPIPQSDDSPVATGTPVATPVSTNAVIAIQTATATATQPETAIPNSTSTTAATQTAIPTLGTSPCFVLREFTFSTDGDFEGWTVNHRRIIPDATVTNGCLQGTGDGFTVARRDLSDIDVPSVRSVSIHIQSEQLGYCLVVLRTKDDFERELELPYNFYGGDDETHVLTVSFANIDTSDVTEIAIYPNMYNGGFSIDKVAFNGVHQPTPTPTAVPEMAAPSPMPPQIETVPALAIGTGQGAPRAGYRLYEPDGNNLDDRVTTVTLQTASIDLAAADLAPGSSGDELVIGTGGPENDRGYLSVIDPQGPAQLDYMFPFAASENSMCVNEGNEVFVAAGNLLGSETPEILAAQGAGGDGWFRIIPFVNQQFVDVQENTFRAPDLGTPPGGISIAAGDIDGDGYDEIITGQFGAPDSGTWHSACIQAINIREPEKRLDPNTAISSADMEWAPAFATFSRHSNLSNAVRIAAGDVDGDGIDEIVVVTACLQRELAPGLSQILQGGNRLMILEPSFSDRDFRHGTFDLAKSENGIPMNIALYSATRNPSGDIFLDVSDVDGDGIAEIITARGSNAAREVLVYSYDPSRTGCTAIQLIHEWTAFEDDENPTGGMDTVVFQRELTDGVAAR